MRLLASALLLSAATACSDGAGPASIDAGDGPPAAIVARQYVVSRLQVPDSAAAAMAFGLDIDDNADGVDNQLGTVIASLRSVSPGLDLPAATALAVDRGEILFLLELRAPDVGSGPATLATAFGIDPQPAPCDGIDDPICRRHLDGTGELDLDPAAGLVMPVAGTVEAARFAGRGTVLLVELALPRVAPVAVPLRRAQIELHGVSATGFGPGSKLGGAVARNDLQGVVFPALTRSIQAEVEHDCPPPRAGPQCNCPSGSGGGTLIGLVDDDDDCNISEGEVTRVLDGFLTNDIDLNGDLTNDAVSFGVGLEGVHASFPSPP